MYEPEERPSSITRYLLPVLAVAIVVGVVAAIVFVFDVGGGDGDGEQETVASSPTVAPSPTPSRSPEETAIDDYVRTVLNGTYSGDCSAAVVNQQQPAATAPAGDGTPGPAPAANSLCSQHRGEREDVKAYVLGLPLAEPSYWVFLEPVGGGFQVLDAVEITTEVTAVPGTPWPLRPGAEVVVTGAAPCLNVREGPALDQAAPDCIPDGTTVIVASGPVEGDGYQWWQLEGRAGWVVDLYLRYPDESQ